MGKYKKIRKGSDGEVKEPINWKQILTIAGAVILILAFILPMIVQTF